jgi:Predicted dehydrogenases and related proteins
MKALKAGKHILVEKPMATNSDEINQITSISKEKNLIAMVGHTFIFNKAVRYIKTIIDDGELGDIRYIYSQRLNLGRIRNDIDALWNLAPHDISIVQYWLDNQDPIKIKRTGMDYVQDGIDDVVFLNLTYPDKIIVNIHVSWLDPLKVRKMIIVGTKKMIVYDDISDNKISIYDKGIDKMAVLGENMDFDKPFRSTFNYRSGDVIMPKIQWEEPLKLEINHFLECITKGIDCIAGPESAGEVVKILECSN